MSASERRRLYVWVWLPLAVEPIPAGVIEQWDTQVVFVYGESYLANSAVLSIHTTREHGHRLGGAKPDLISSP